MMDLVAIGGRVAQRRKELRLTQTDLACNAGVSRATVDALENGRLGELGFTKLLKLLAALRLELKLQAATSHRPTLDDLLKEDEHD